MHDVPSFPFFFGSLLFYFSLFCTSGYNRLMESRNRVETLLHDVRRSCEDTKQRVCRRWEIKKERKREVKGWRKKKRGGKVQIRAFALLLWHLCFIRVFPSLLFGRFVGRSAVLSSSKMSREKQLPLHFFAVSVRRSALTGAHKCRSVRVHRQNCLFFKAFTPPFFLFKVWGPR